MNFVEKPFGRRGPDGIGVDVRGGTFSGATGVKIMRVKMLAVALVLAVSAAVFVQMHKDNRAEAAASNCYSDAQGPSTPTVCN